MVHIPMMRPTQIAQKDINMVAINTNEPKVHLVVPDSHAHPDYNNDRADWLGQLIADLKPVSYTHLTLPTIYSV